MTKPSPSPMPLKNCPFCGGPAKISEPSSTIYGRYFYEVGCPVCPDAIFYDREQWKDGLLVLPEKECVERWNARTPGSDGLETKTLKPGTAFHYNNSTALGLVHFVGINPHSGAIVVTNSEATDKHLRQIAGWDALVPRPENDIGAVSLFYAQSHAACTNRL